MIVQANVETIVYTIAAGRVTKLDIRAVNEASRSSTAHSARRRPTLRAFSKAPSHTFNKKKAIFYGHCETSRSFVDSSTGQLDTGLTHAEDEAAAGRAPRHEPLLVVNLAEQEAAVLLEHLPQDNPPSEGDLTCRCSPWCPSA